MCGRFTLRSSPEQVAAEFDLETPPELAPRYNIAPGQDVAVLRRDPDSPARRLERLHWGFVPGWARNPASGQRMINARAETVASKPAFREALRKRRCLIPADGFYEWAAQRGSAKQPYLFTRADGGLLAFAGLFETWHAGAVDELRSCTIVTTRANAVLEDVHERMPVILAREHHATWLDPQLCDPEPLVALLRPAPAELLVRVSVGLRVNDVRNDDPDCATAAPPQPRQPELF